MEFMIVLFVVMLAWVWHKIDEALSRLGEIDD